MTDNTADVLPAFDLVPHAWFTLECGHDGGASFDGFAVGDRFTCADCGFLPQKIVEVVPVMVATNLVVVDG